MADMKRFDGIASIDRPFNRAVIAMGNFDGVHLGHQTIIRKTVEQARRDNGTAVVYTFHPHPVRILAPESCPPLLQTLDQRLEELERLGIDACVVEHFTLNLAHEEPRHFFTRTLKDRLGARTILVGYDFTFGLHRRGTAEVLKQFGAEADVDVTVVEAQFAGELLISSTEIRHVIAHGHVENARELMGRPFALRGPVMKGLGIGSTLGAHTANISAENGVMPAPGVYVTLTRRLTEQTMRPSVTSIGNNPTFPGRPFSVETHLIDFEGDLSGSRLDIMFLHRLRGQVAFDTPATLAGQIARDIEEARKWHERNPL